MIPEHIHQTWKEEQIPVPLRPYTDSWRRHHPAWQYTLWTDAMNRDFIAQYYPGFLRTYDAYPYPIQRVDAVRYFILERYGGLFVDLDFECLRAVAPLLSEGSFVAGLEPQEHALRHHKNFIISNAFMAARPGAAFINTICHKLQDNDYMLRSRERGFNAVLDCAGPFMLSRTYDQYTHKEEVKILAHELLYPLVKDPLTSSVPAGGRDNASITGKAYAIHHYWGSWWRG